MTSIYSDVARRRQNPSYSHRLLFGALCWAFAMVFVCSLASAQNGEIVKAIEIQGLNKVDRNKVLYALPVKVGEPYRPRRPGEILHAINEMGYFTGESQVFTEKVDGGIKLIVIVEEAPSVREVDFVGNTKLPESALKDACSVKPGDLLAPDTAVRIRSAVERTYRAKGYNDANVIVTVADRSTTQVAIQVVVDEGLKLKIKDLIIRGNESVATALLRIRLENQGSWLFIKNFYDNEAFLTDLDMIRLYYITKGFLDVKVKAGEFIKDPGGKWVSPVIEIQEGPRYTVGQIWPSGVTRFMPIDIVEIFRPLQGKYYNAELFMEAIEKVKTKYGDEGFINAEVSYDYETNPQTRQVHFNLRIEEHERVYVRKILIRKNEYPNESPTFIERLHGKLSPPVSDEIIEREVVLKPGEAYRRFQEVATVDRLRSMGIFDSVDVDAALTDDETKRDAVLKLEEGNTGNLLFGVGVSERAGAYLHGAYINRNLFGQARHLRTSFLLGTRDMSFRIGYLDRYFDLPGEALDRYFQTDRSGLVPFRLELYRDRMRLSEYEETHTGISALLTRISRRGILTEDYGVRLEYVETDDDGHDYSDDWFFFDDDDHDDDDEPEEDFNDYPVLALSYYLEENTTDDWWWPTQGHILGGGVEAGAADGALLKLKGRYSLYKKLGSKLIYALNTQAGLMPLGADEVGISERLFLGGSSDMRGFEFRGAGPVDDGDEDLHIGGSTKLLVQNELRFPIYKQLKGFTFLDAGMLGEDEFEFEDPRVSVGAGVRFSTARSRMYGPRWKTGPTGLDIMRGFNIEVSVAAPIVKESEDDEQYIHVIMGSSF